MLAALIIVFREVIEAGLIVGIVLAATVSVPRRGWWVAGGAGAGTLGAVIVAMFAGAISAAFAGVGQELLNAAILAVAVVMLTWHNVWMARHGREMAAEMRAVGQAVVAGTRALSALAVVVGVAVLREGFEVVLFLYGVIAAEGGTGAGIVAGGFAGLALGALVSALTYFGLLKIPSRYLFAVTSVLIALLAAGMAAQAVAYLEQANAVTALETILWDSSNILSDSSLVGRALHTLVGYTDRPTEMQALAYLATLALMFVLMRTAAPIRQPVSGRG